MEPPTPPIDGAAAHHPPAVVIRRTDSDQIGGDGDEVLRRTLQRRLRVVLIVAAFGFSAQATLGFLYSPYNQERLRTQPFSAGSPLLYWIVGGAFLATAILLDSRWRRPMPLLRAIEVAAFGLMGVLCAQLLMYDYETFPREVFTWAATTTSLAHSFYWTIIAILYASVIPGTARRTAWALGLIGLAATFPDTWALSKGFLPSDIAPLIFGTKGVALGAVSLAVWFGSYRYERVVKRAAAARDLGPYTISRPLGAGGMGEVYLAEHRLLRRPVALKLIRPAQAGSLEATTRFEREAKAVAQLSHPNTVHVFDYGRSEDGTFYCVMEYLDGETLDVVVERDGPMPLVRAVHVLTQLCGALAEAHERGLVHRDIKPGNVILGPRGGVPDVAKLLDFGLVIDRAPLADSDPRVTEAGHMVGTPEYMSPEQCGAGDGVVGPASDLYALGALGCFLLTGRSPFGGRSVVQQLVAHIHERPIAPSMLRPDIPAALDAVLLRALAKAPAERFTDADAMANALRDALAVRDDGGVRSPSPVSPESSPSESAVSRFAG